MLSKTVTDRVKASDSVREALKGLGPSLGVAAEGLLGPYLKKGEGMPDVGLLGVLVERLLGARSEGMARADAAHNEELADDGEPREERDLAARETYSALVGVKLEVGTLFGERWVGKLKFPGEIPQDAPGLSRLAPEVAKAIREAKLPKPRTAVVKSVDRGPWVAKIEEPAKRLEAALKGVTREAREAQKTLVEKTRAVAAYDDAFSKGVAVAGALLRLVGETEHAERLRPSVKRPGTLASEEEASPEEGESAAEEGGSDSESPG